MVSYDGVEDRVEVIEQVDHLDGFAVGRDGGEADDVAEIKRHAVEMLGLDCAADLQSLSHRPEGGKRRIR